MIKIVVATGNRGKIKEIKEILNDDSFEVVAMRDAGIDVDVDETGKTFRENAYLKAKEIHSICGGIVIADDSGLCVDYLNGAPGVYSARYSGDGCNDDNNNAKLLDVMKDVGDNDRGAHFNCTICCVMPCGTEFYSEGNCYGKIAREKRGAGGFGYDPLFYVEKLGKTFSELTLEEKNKISHRAIALANFKKELIKKIKE